MTSQSRSTSPTQAKKPRRHLNSRGVRKHVRELKRLGLMENHRRRKTRLEHAAWLAHHPIPEPKRQDPRPPPPDPRRGGGGGGGEIQRVYASDLLRAKSPENLCPGHMCGRTSPGAYVTVYDRDSMANIQVRRCPSCQQLYRDCEVPTYATLPTATSDWNDCAYGCGWQSNSKTGHISSIRTADVGNQNLCTCGNRKCGKFYKPYVAPVRGSGSSWWD